MQIIQHETDVDRLGIQRLPQLFDAVCPGARGTLIGHCRMLLPRAGRTRQEEIGRAIARLGGVVPQRCSWVGGQRHTHFAKQLGRFFLHT